MDTSETFIKMCEKAGEIQGLKSCKYRPDSVNLPWWDRQGNCWFNQNNDRTAWLPRQDQLQDMVSFGHVWLPFANIERWWQWAKEKMPLEYWDRFTSMEQLWLAFVMKEKYNKVWNGNDWLCPG